MDVLATVREYRHAARRAVDADAPERLRFVALIDLVTAARQESDPVTRLWSERAVFEESRALLGMDDEPILLPESYVVAARGLLAQGYTTCPCCRRDLPTRDQLDREERLRRAHLDEVQRRERAGEVR